MELFPDITLKCSCNIISSISLILAVTACLAPPVYAAPSCPPSLCELTSDSGVARCLLTQKWLRPSVGAWFENNHLTLAVQPNPPYDPFSNRRHKGTFKQCSTAQSLLGEGPARFPSFLFCTEAPCSLPLLRILGWTGVPRASTAGTGLPKSFTGPVANRKSPASSGHL